MPPRLAQKIDEMAARMERSRGWVVKPALVAGLEQEEQRSRRTLEALADVDAGSLHRPLSRAGLGCQP